MDPIAVRRNQLPELIGSEQIAREIIDAGWLKPIVERHKLSLYLVADVTKAVLRLRNETPQPTSKRSK